MLSSEPATIATLSPAASSREASSVAPTSPARWAASSTGNRKAWGVCARNSPSRDTVSVITPPATRFSVSATGAAGMAPGWVFKASVRSGIVRAGKNGRAASCTSTMSGAKGSKASNPARTLSWRVAPPGTTGRCGRPASAASIGSSSPTGWRNGACSASRIAA